MFLDDFVCNLRWIILTGEIQFFSVDCELSVNDTLQFMILLGKAWVERLKRPKMPIRKYRKKAKETEKDCRSEDRRE